MSSQIIEFKCAIVTGGGGGIGRALSAWLISVGVQVIIAGRTLETLEKTVKEIGATAYYQLDTGDVQAIEGFVRQVTKDHPEVYALINNAGVQWRLEVEKMDADEFLNKADNEIDIKIRGPLHLALRLLPHLKMKDNAAIVNVGSVLGYVPFSVINPVYNGTKAILHFWTMALRTQLAGHSNIRVIETAPPTVATDLHRERDDPDDNKKEKNKAALSLEDFIDEVSDQWRKGTDTITVGSLGHDLVSKWYKTFGPDYEKWTNG